ncbi:MAG: RNA methyltransferase [Dehalococcoidales bacterium]
MNDYQSNPLRSIKWYRKLALMKGRRETGFFLMEGDRAIRQVMDISPASINEIVTSRDLPPFYSGYSQRRVSEIQLSSICNTRTPQGPVAVIRYPREIYSSRLPETTGRRVLLLEDIQDPGNAGTLVRTAAAFDYDGVIMSDRCADPLSPKFIQSSAGSILSLWLRRTHGYLAMVEQLKKKGYPVIVAALDGAEKPRVLEGRGSLLLALGNETSGPSESLKSMAEHNISIDIARKKAESLNVAVCGAICLYLSNRL